MKKPVIALLTIAFMVVVGWVVFRGRDLNRVIKPPAQTAMSEPAVTSEPPARTSVTVVHSNEHPVSIGLSGEAPASSSIPKVGAPPLEVATVEPTFESTNLPPETIVENMRTRIRQYGAMFGGNPVGTNPEITKALQGDNPKHIDFLKPDGNRVNTKGELVDPWGTPYFFHQLSASETEIRSAGPDRVMYTADDLVIK